MKLCVLWMCAFSHAIGQSLNKNFDTNLDIYNSYSGTDRIALLQEAFKNGDVEAGGHLSFAWALGLGVQQNLKDASFHSQTLASSGAARAHTTLALLLHHNLTEVNLPREDRENKALEHYAVAAIKGDPLAQIFMSGHYEKKGDCEAALSYSRRAASIAIQSLKEMEFVRPSFVNYVQGEDSPIPMEMFPDAEKLQFFEHLASHGDAGAAFEAASIYMAGAPGLKRDISKAEELLKIAIEGNNTLAMVFRAQLYLRDMSGITGEEAFQLLQTAADYGLGLAYSGLARFYMEGRGVVQKNFQKAEELFKKGMEAGNIDSFFQFAKLYVAKGDLEKAAELWYLPATFGHGHSAWNLAEYYRAKFQDTTSLAVATSKAPPNPNPMNEKLCQAALPFYRMVALSGKWKDLFEDAYEDYTSNRKEAALLKYLLLSDLGYVAGHINAARILEESETIVYNSSEATNREALESWKKAAKEGSARGYVKWGNYQYYGIGQAPDIAAAASNYQNAANLRDPEGMFNHALVTEWGEGVSQNVTRAREIFNQLRQEHSEAEVPVALALFRLEAFRFINDSLSVDLYKTDLSSAFDYVTEFRLAKSIVLYWDIFIMILLICLILVAYYARQQ